MSSNTDETCASCGITGGDDVKLLLCTACKLIRYCSVECQKNHRPQHKKACKKRAAEIRDDLLFTPPEGNFLGECPLCCLPFPLDNTKRVINSCCCKRICRGCDWANKKREDEAGLEHKCPFCREPLPLTKEELDQNYEKRLEANDPNAMRQMGNMYDTKGDYDGAFEYYTKAAALGDIGSHYQLGHSYHEGKGVEKDIKKELFHLKEAAIGGHPLARYNLGLHEWGGGRMDRAMKHFIIAANLGHVYALDRVKEGYMGEILSKDEYASTLRGHQAALDATKSQQREEAEKARQGGFYVCKDL